MNHVDTVSDTLWARHVKRVSELVLSSLVLVLLSPLLFLIAILIKVTSRGPLFFRQDRAGRHGRIFRPFKFRTMRGDRRPDPGELVPLAHPDITPIGRLLRRFKLDELPQLINVLHGEMALVGPRPTLPDQVARYDQFRRRRLLVYPGLTGLAQVYSSASATWEERILYDIAYVQRCRFALDLLILARTPWVMLLGEERTRRSFMETPFANYVSVPPGFFPGVGSSPS